MNIIKYVKSSMHIKLSFYDVYKYFIISKWYSNSVIILLQRKSCKLRRYSLKDGHTLRRVTFNNVEDTQVFESKKYADIYRNMLQQGDYGFFGYVDGRCACRCWGKVHPELENYYGENLYLANDSILVHYVETAKHYRRQGIGKECLSELITTFEDKQMYVFINIQNYASMSLHKKLGFQEIAVIYARRRLGKYNSIVHWINNNDEK